MLPTTVKKIYVYEPQHMGDPVRVEFRQAPGAAPIEAMIVNTTSPYAYTDLMSTLARILPDVPIKTFSRAAHPYLPAYYWA